MRTERGAGICDGNAMRERRGEDMVLSCGREGVPWFRDPSGVNVAVVLFPGFRFESL